jgi:hypothetical protein
MAETWHRVAEQARPRYKCAIAFSRFAHKLLVQASEQHFVCGFQGMAYFFPDGTSIVNPGNGKTLVLIRGLSNASGWR